MKPTDDINAEAPTTGPAHLTGTKLPTGTVVGNPAFDAVLKKALSSALRGLGDVTHSELAYAATEWVSKQAETTITEADVNGVIAAVLAKLGSSNVSPSRIAEICDGIRSNIGAERSALGSIRAEALSNAEKAAREALTSILEGGDERSALMSKLAAVDKLITETFARQAQYINDEERDRMRRLTELRDQHPHGSEAWLQIERQRLEAAGEIASQGAGRARARGDQPAAQDLSAAERAAKEAAEASKQHFRATRASTPQPRAAAVSEPTRESAESQAQEATVEGVTLAPETAINTGLPGRQRATPKIEI